MSTSLVTSLVTSCGPGTAFISYSQVQDKDLVTIMFHMRSLGVCAGVVLLRLLYDIFMVGNVGD